MIIDHLLGRFVVVWNRQCCRELFIGFVLMSTKGVISVILCTVISNRNPRSIALKTSHCHRAAAVSPLLASQAAVKHDTWITRG